MSEDLDRLVSIVEQIGQATIATTETVERLAERVDTLAVEIRDRDRQMQQQSYQIFALSEALQSLAESQSESRQQFDRLTEVLEKLVAKL